MAHRLRVAAKHIGKGSAPGLLYDFGNYPGAVFGPEKKYRVIGDVFVLGRGPRLLADLDKYEGVTRADGEEAEWPEAEGMFHRIAIEVEPRPRRHGRGLDLRLEGTAAGEADRHRRFHRRSPLARPQGRSPLNHFR